MTNEQRKAYRREWQRNNRERTRKYKLDVAIREVIAEINQERERQNMHSHLISDPAEDLRNE